MSQKNPELRSAFILPIFFLYLIPVIALSAYGLDSMAAEQNWSLFSVGAILAIVGSLIFYFILHRWETSFSHELQQYTVEEKAESIPTPVQQTISREIDPAERLEKERLMQEVSLLKKQQEQLRIDESELENELAQLLKENERLQEQLQTATHELASFQQGIQLQLDQKDQLALRHQQTIAEQRDLIERHQQHITILQSKEKDLSYEIKTLLQLTKLDAPNEHKSTIESNPKDSKWYVQEMSHSYQAEPLSYHVKRIDNPASALSQLKQYLDIATKMAGANYLNGSTSKVHHLPVDNYALDLRRLCDALNSESNSLVFLYSQKENKLLFANEQAMDLLGWNKEKFLESFPDIISQGLEEWKMGLNLLTSKDSTAFSISLRSRGGQDIPFRCHLGSVSAGTFRHHAIGILYPQASV